MERLSENTGLLTKFVYVAILRASQKSGDKIIWLALKEMNYLEVIFMLFWIKKRLIYFKIQSNETKSRSSNIKQPSTETFQVQILVLYQSNNICEAGPLRTDYIDEVPDISDSHPNIRTSFNSSLELPNFKICA